MSVFSLVLTIVGLVLVIVLALMGNLEIREMMDAFLS